MRNRAFVDIYFKVTDCKPMKGNEKVENNEDLRQQLGTERREDEPCHH